MVWAQSDAAIERKLARHGEEPPERLPETVEDTLERAAGALQLTPRMQAFAERWLVHGNGRRAAQEAGYSGSEIALGTTATRLLASDKISKYINIVSRYAMHRAGVSPERIIREMAHIAFARAEDLTDDDGNARRLSEIPEETRAAIMGIEVDYKKTDEGYERHVKYKLGDKQSALNTLAKMAGLQIDKIAIGGSEDMPAIKTEDINERDAIRGLMFAIAKHRVEHAKAMEQSAVIESEPVVVSES